MQSSLVALAPEVLRSLTHQAQVDRRTLVHHLSNPSVRSRPAGKRIREAIQANGLDHLLATAEKGR